MHVGIARWRTSFLPKSLARPMLTPFARVLALFLALLSAGSAAPTPLQTKVRTWRQSQERAIIDEYREFLSIPNTALDRANIRRNADFIVAMMQRRGIEARILTVRSSNANPYVYGEVKVPGATRTVMLYAHFDGQPVNPAQWAPGWEPFTPKFATASHEQGGTLINAWKSGDAVDPQWRITGRGSADDKAGVMVLLNAYSAL